MYTSIIFFIEDGDRLIVPKSNETPSVDEIIEKLKKGKKQDLKMSEVFSEWFNTEVECKKVTSVSVNFI
ncbi:MULTISPECIES: hypothetical protein [Marinococcus]|uniref:hypothetical protein n=1 Tax=Marinococcus TaxID=1370 RepID=UPI0003B31F63|nr:MULTISPECIES: hypothetical protein [Marinococcus]MDX6152836.1 hypothetical protein [Marinococcus sp. PL1-022]MDZ5782143.1 hypothetical protein [Marinococcus luteus]